MRNMEKFKALRNKLKNEYPFRPQRLRGDAIDKPIEVRLPSMRQWSSHCVLQPLTAKKAFLEMNGSASLEHEHGARDNEVEYLLEIENKVEEEEREQREREKEEKRERKRRKKEKRRRRKEKALLSGGTVDGMECDDGTQDEDDDIKMNETPTEGKGAESGKPKVTKQNTLSKYFKASPPKALKPAKTEEKDKGIKRKMADVDTKGTETKSDSKGPEPKKKKRRVVMCELVE